MASRKARQGPQLLLLLLSVLLMAGSSWGATIMGVSHTSFASCDPVEGLQFVILGTDLNDLSCVFTPLFAGGEELTFASIPSGGGITCSITAFFRYGEYRVGVLSGSDVIYNTSNITVSPSPVSLEDSYFLQFSSSYYPGQDIDVEVSPFSACGAPASCDEGGELAFTFDFPGHPEIATEFVERNNAESCVYRFSQITLKGAYDYDIFYNSTLFGNSTFNVAPGIDTVNQTLSSVTATTTTVTAGITACIDITLMDSYGNTVEGVSVSQLLLTWFNTTSPTVQGKTLEGETDGTYEVCFLPTTGGSQHLNVQVNQVSISGAPLALTVLSGAFDMSKSVVRSGLVCPPSCDTQPLSVTAVSGVSFFFTIVPRDQYQNQKNDLSDIDLGLFDCKIVAESTLEYPATVTKDGAYLKATFVGEAAGSYSFIAQYNGVDADGGIRSSVTVVAGAVSLSDSVPNLLPVTGVAGEAVQATVIARDAALNFVNGDSLWTAKAEVAGVPISQSCTVSGSGSGVYTASCLVNATGSHQIRFSYNGTALSGSKPITITPAATSATFSTFDGFPSTMGSNTTASLRIHKRDLFGNEGGTIRSHQFFQVQIQLMVDGRIAERFLSSDVQETSPGSNEYSISFSLGRAGSYSVSVLFGGAQLTPGKTPVITVTPGATVGDMCTLDPAYTPASPDVPLHFTLRARDAIGNVQVFDEISKFRVSATNLMSENAGVNCTIGQSGTAGVYNVSCPFKVVGQYSLVGSFNGVAAFTSSSPVEIVPGVITPSSSSFDPTTVGFKQTVAGRNTEIVIQCRDVAGNPLRAAENFTITITKNGAKRDGPTVFVTRVEDDVRGSQGVAVYSYNVSQSGSYSLSVSLDGEEISGSPSTLVVSPAPADLSTASYEFSSASPYSTKIGQVFSLSLTLEDQFGNPVSNQDSLSASLLGTQDFGGFAPGTVTFDGSGLYRISFEPEMGGVYQLNVVVNGNDIPQNITVAVFSDYGGSCTEFESNLNQGQKWDLICNSFDEYGREKRTGGDTVTYEADKGSVSVQDVGDGRYIVTYSSNSIGKRTLSLTIGGKVATNMPYRPVIIPGAVVLGTVIPAMFVLGILVVAGVYLLRRRRIKQQLLLSRQRKPQQVFKAEDDGEWSDDEGYGDEAEENWYKGEIPLNDIEKQKQAHNIVMHELEN